VNGNSPRQPRPSLKNRLAGFRFIRGNRIPGSDFLVLLLLSVVLASAWSVVTTLSNRFPVTQDKGFTLEYQRLLAEFKTLESKRQIESLIPARGLIKLAEATNNLHAIASAYKDLAETAEDKVKISDYSFKSLEIWEKLGDKKSAAFCLNKIGEIFRATADFEKSLQYLSRAVELCRSIDDSDQLAYALNRIGAVYYEIALKGDQNAIRTSIDYTTQSEVLAERTNNNYLKMSNFNILGSNYVLLKEYRKAQDYLLLALTIIDRHSFRRDKPNILNNLSNNYFRLNDFSNCIKYGLESYQIAQEYGILTYLEVASAQLSRVYQQLGDYKQAYDYLEKSFAHHNNGFFNERNQKIFELQTKYETERKELQLEAQKIRQTNTVLVFSLVMCLVLAGVLMLTTYSRQLKKFTAEIQMKNKLISGQNEELATLNASKDKFLSIIAHDLKGPFTSILGYSDLLHNKFDSLDQAQKKEFIRIICTSTEDVLNLLNNLLQWAFAQSGNIIFSPTSFDLGEVILRCVNHLRVQAESKNIRLVTSPSNNVFVQADENMIQTVIRNLISNAIKFTHPGGIIQIESHDIPDHLDRKAAPMVELSVADDGVGFSREALENLFRIDRKVKSSGTANESGSGLGLILCQEFMQYNGGTIRVESELGKGSRVIITIPRPTSKSVAPVCG
jgi:signal transduction histidine kinase